MCQYLLNPSFEQMVQNLQLDTTDLVHCLGFHVHKSGDVAEVAERETRLLDFGVAGYYLSVELLMQRVRSVWEDIRGRREV